MKQLLIDGDVAIYKAAFICEQVTDWGDGVLTRHADCTSSKPLGHLISDSKVYFSSSS